MSGGSTPDADRAARNLANRFAGERSHASRIAAVVGDRAMAAQRSSPSSDLPRAPDEASEESPDVACYCRATGRRPASRLKGP